jgi:beta-mannanase
VRASSTTRSPTGAASRWIGAIGEGETWAKAADGAYDRRWRRSLTELQRLWGDRSGTLYIRFAHEMNGDWYPWAVNDENHEDFMAAWKRFRALQQEIFPASQLVFCLTRESVNSDIDWRETFPGPEYVDVLGVDYYNQYPYVDTADEFDEAATELDEFGGPKGIQGYIDFAREQGLPLAVPEWGGNADEGDAPAFIASMYEVFARDGGTGPGQVLNEIVFNVAGYDDAFQMFPDTAMPNSTEQYRRLW